MFRSTGLSCEWLASLSRSSLDRVLSREAELVVAVPGDEAVAIGAFQRSGDAPTGARTVRRGSGGAAARVGPGSVWVQLALARPDVLVACDGGRLLNRYVRPLLAALTKSGALAHYFGRDWISVARRPAALVAFGHDARTGRSLVEAIVGVTTPFDAGARPSFMGKSPAAVVDVAPKAAPAAVAEAIVAAYLSAYDAEAALVEVDAPTAESAEEDPPWQAVREEAIGTIAAGRDREGRLRVGGELMASRDAVAALEEAVARGEDPGRATNDALAAPGVVTFGVRDLASVRDVVVEALAR